MTKDHIEFQDRSAPVGYLITIRTYGTWLHGDERGSMDRSEYNQFGSPKIPVRSELEKSDRFRMKYPAFILNTEARNLVREGIWEVCCYRSAALFSVNVRSNHAHVVVSAGGPPEPLMNSFKAYATRKLRASGIAGGDQRVWSRHGSTRYLWTDEHISKAIDYVEYGQGDDLPDFGNR